MKIKSNYDAIDAIRKLTAEINMLALNWGDAQNPAMQQITRELSENLRQVADDHAAKCRATL